MNSTAPAPPLPDAPDRERTTRAGLLALAVTAAVVVIFRDDVLALWNRWAQGGPSNLALFIGPMLPWLIWRERGRIAVPSRSPILLASLLLVLLGLGWAFAKVAEVSIVRQALLPLIALAGILLLLGPRAARATLFPLLWCETAVIDWGRLIPVLQSATAKAATQIVGAFGVPVYIDGNFVQIPAGTFEVASGCSGLNFFVVTVTLALLWGQLLHWTVRRRIGFLLVSMATAVVFNWIRVAIIVIVGEYTAMRSPLIAHHITFGWFLYAIAILGLGWAAGRHGSGSAPPPVTTARPPAPAEDSPGTGTLLLRGALLLGLLLAPWAATAMYELRASTLEGTVVDLPVAAEGWRREDGEHASWRPVLPGASSVARATYQRAASQVEVDVRYFATEGPGRKLISAETNPDGTGPGWQLVAAGVRRAPNASPTPVRELVLRDTEGRRWLVWRWYQVGSVATASPLRAKLLEGLRLFTAPQGSAAIALATRCEATCRDEAADRALGEFLAAHGPALRIAAEGTRPNSTQR